MAMEAFWVIGAAFANFILGAVWYAIFGKQWLLAWKLKGEEIKPLDPKPYLVAFIGSLWASYGIFLIAKHIQPKDLSELLAIAVGCWLFIEVGMGAKHYAFARRNGKAFAIDFGVDLIGFIVITFMVA